MRFFAAATALILTASAQLQQTTPTFRSTTRLVELSVTALDKDGKGITDLAQKEFTVLENGEPRAIAIFRFEGATPAELKEAPAASLPAGVFTNSVEFTPGPVRNITALVIDELNTAPQDSMRVRAMVTRYLKALTPQTRMAVYHMSRKLTVLHDFTDDFESLRARVQKSALALPLQHEGDFDRSVIEAEQLVNMFAGDPQMQAMMEEVMRNQLEVEMMMDAAARRRRLDLTLVTMEALGRHLEGIPGRKSLIWISGGISIISVTGAMGFGPRGGIESYEDKIRRTSQRLAQQGVVLYIVDAKGLTLPNWMSASSPGAMPVRGRGRFEPQQDAVNMSTDPFPAMNLMASTTGGRFLHNTNDLLAGFSRAAADLRGSYTLGFYATEEPDRKWHKVSVRVSRKGVNVRHRQGYLAELPAGNRGEWTPESWNAVISNPIGSTAVLVTASAVALKESGNVRIALRLEPSSLHFRKDGNFLQADIQITVADKPVGGAARRHTESASVRLEAAKWAAAARGGLAWGREWKPLEEAVMARVIVRDMTTGRYGTLDVPLKKIPVQ